MFYGNITGNNNKNDVKKDVKKDVKLMALIHNKESEYLECVYLNNKHKHTQWQFFEHNLFNFPLQLKQFHHFGIDFWVFIFIFWFLFFLLFFCFAVLGACVTHIF